MRVKKFQIESESLTSQLNKVDDKSDNVRALMEKVSPEYLSEFWNQLDISAIYHDCALEGEVIAPDELNAALDPRTATDATNLALFSAIRNHKKSFAVARNMAVVEQIEFNVNFFEKIHQIFSVIDIDSDQRGFRKDIPLHRTYFHEISQAAQIPEKMDELILWMSDLSNRQSMHPLSWAARFHYKFMRIFPYSDTTGKVGRMAMNIYLMRNGFLPAIIHSTERQRYYESIRGSYAELTQLIIDSEMAALDSATRFLRRAAGW